jgi:hypothetical protein
VEIRDDQVFEQVFCCGPSNVVPIWKDERWDDEVEEDSSARSSIVYACGWFVIVPACVEFRKIDVCEGEVECGGAFQMVMGEEGVKSTSVNEGVTAIEDQIIQWVGQAEFLM